MRIATLIATVVLGAGVVSAQSLGDAARQERARRAGLEKHARVLTNEDFSREQILPAQIQESAAQPAVWSPAASPAAAENQEVSLGEYARIIRAERAQREGRAPINQSADATSTAPAAAGERLWVKDDSGVPAWTAHEQPGFSLGEYARVQRALRRKDVPVQLTLDAKATPAPPKPPSLAAKQNRKSAPARSTAFPAAAPAEAILVQKGDSLWKLSRTNLGEGRLWPAIWAANPQIRNPHLIHPGQSLSRPTELEVAKVRQSITKNPVVLAKLAPAPQPLFQSPRTVRLQLGGGHGRQAITGQVDLPAGLVLPVRRAGFSGPAADRKRRADGASHDRAAAQPAANERSLFPDLPGHLGLR